MRKISIILFIQLICQIQSFANDSIYFYRNDQIIYRDATKNIDSLTFHSYADYRITRSLEVLKALEDDAETRSFASWIVTAGMQYDLDSATIWAPDQESMAPYLHVSDSRLIRLFVRNHISKPFLKVYSYASEQKIPMLSGKNLRFKSGETASLNNITIKTRNLQVSRSMVHILNGSIPYQHNLWEYITQDQGHDKMKNFFNSCDTLKYDLVTGSNILYNPLKEILPFLIDENAENTVIIPNDEAWDNAWNKFYPLCKEKTGMAIIQQLFFRGLVEPTGTDTLLTAFSSKQFTNPARLFEGAVAQTLSNGRVLNTGHLYAYDPEYWGDGKIVMEAEDAGWGRTSNNYNLSIYPHQSDSLVVSGGKYLSAISTSSSSSALLNVIYPIPNTLIGKYNISCVFAPANILVPDNLKPFKMRFKIQTIKDGVTQSFFVGENNSLVTARTSAKLFITNPRGITKVRLFENYEFTIPNIILNAEKLSTPENMINFTVFVENATSTSASERLNFNRDINIDCIILEPVSN